MARVAEGDASSELATDKRQEENKALEQGKAAVVSKSMSDCGNNACKVDLTRTIVSDPLWLAEVAVHITEIFTGEYPQAVIVIEFFISTVISVAVLCNHRSCFEPLFWW